MGGAHIFKKFGKERTGYHSFGSTRSSLFKGRWEFTHKEEERLKMPRKSRQNIILKEKIETSSTYWGQE